MRANDYKSSEADVHFERRDLEVLYDLELKRSCYE